MRTTKFTTKNMDIQLKDWTKMRKKQVREQVTDSANVVESEAVQRVSVGATAALKVSIGINYRDKGMTAEIGSGVMGGEQLVYAEALEFGRKPGGFPPWKENSALYYWVKMKLGIRGKLTKAVAFMIARKISKFGFKKRPYLMPAYNRERPIFERKIKKIMNKTSK